MDDIQTSEQYSASSTSDFEYNSASNVSSHQLIGMGNLEMQFG